MNAEKRSVDGGAPASFHAAVFDAGAFELFFKNNFKALCGYCQYKFDIDLEASKDMVHTGFARIWENRQTISAELSVKAYLYKIVHNLCLDALKGDRVKRRHIHALSVSMQNETPEDHGGSVDFKKLEDAVQKSIGELPEQMRKIFELSRYEELTYAEIARQLNLSVKTVETQMGRALAKLRKKLDYYLSPSLILLVLAAETCSGFFFNHL